MPLFCEHTWEFISFELIPSIFEELEKEGFFKNIRMDLYMEGIGLQSPLFMKRISVICLCTNCGKLQKITEEKPLI
jgi:hypothetical protein